MVKTIAKWDNGGDLVTVDIDSTDEVPVIIRDDDSGASIPLSREEALDLAETILAELGD